MAKLNITGPEFRRILKKNNILPSVFAFKTQIELNKVKQAMASHESVPDVIVYKSQQVFGLQLIRNTQPQTAA